MVYQHLSTTAQDCGVQKIAKLAKYKFNVLKDLEDEKLEFQRQQRRRQEEEERKAEQERLDKIEAERAKAAAKQRKKQASRARSKEIQREKTERLKKQLSALPAFGLPAKEETLDEEPAKEERVILKKDGTPLWVIIDCQHQASQEELRV